MTNSFWEVIAETPWYTYFFTGYFIYLMSLTTKPRIIPAKSLYIFPVIIIYFTFYSVYAAKIVNIHTLTLWAGGIVLGYPIGWLQFRIMNVQALKAEKKLYLPGSWLHFLILLIAYSGILYFFYLHPVAKNLLQSQYASNILLLCGAFCGLFIGKLAYSFRCLKN